MFNKVKFNFLFAPITEAPPIGGNKSMSKEDMVDFLLDDKADDKIDLADDKEDKEKPVIDKEDKEDDEEKKEEEDEENPEDELAEIEEEVQDPTEEQLELTTPVSRREILKVYPDLFKKFPYLEKAYYREQQFTEIYATPELAKEAREKAVTLDNLESDLTAGNTEKILRVIKDTNQKSFNKVVDNYLDSLHKIDEKAYYHIIGNVIKKMTYSMASEGKRSKNDVLETAAQIVNQFIFGTAEFQEPSKLSREEDDKPNEREQQISEREKAFTRREFNNAKDNINTKVGNLLKSTISANIDPKETMSDYVKTAASREVYESVTNLIDKDSRFKQLLDTLWDKAFKSDFNDLSMSRIKEAYIAKAKSLLPSVIKKARIDALRGMGKRVREEKDDTPNDDKGEKRKSTPPANSRPKSSSDKKTLQPGMSYADFMLED